MTTSEQWVDAIAVSKHLGFKPDHIRKMARAGKLYAAQTRNGDRDIWRFKLSLVDKWMLEQCTQSTMNITISAPLMVQQAVA